MDIPVYRQSGPDSDKMYVKLILPALTEAKSTYWRSIKYSLFPPLGLVTLASNFPQDWRIEIIDEHVEDVSTDDHPDLVVVEVYITSARRSYEIADSYRSKGVHVVLGGLHTTSMPDEAGLHADTMILGPAEEAWPRFIKDFVGGKPDSIYRSQTRSLESLPALRRELIKNHLYMVPNSVITSRGCPHSCAFCYSTSFFEGGKSYYSQPVDRVLAEVDGLPGRHLFFLDDNLLGNERYAMSLFEGMKGMNRICQGAATVASLQNIRLLEAMAEAGMRSLFVGFETLNQDSLRSQKKFHNDTDKYSETIKRLHDLGIMINASFVFGLDNDDRDVFSRTVAWAVDQGMETATFHLLTPYPGTPLFEKMEKAGRLLHRDWDVYDTRHSVFRHPNMTTAELESGYWRAYKEFYSWKNIIRSSTHHASVVNNFRHFVYTSAWKKFDPAWNAIIKMKKLSHAAPMLERVLGKRAGRKDQGKVASAADSI